MLRSLYIDEAPKVVLREKYVDSLQELGFDGYALMAMASDSEPYRWSRQQLLEFAAAYPRAHTTLVVWPKPRDDWFTRHASAITERLFVCDAATLKFDVEPNNWKSAPKGPGLPRARMCLDAWMQTIKRELPKLRTAITTLPLFHTGVDMMYLFDQAYLQAYSVAKRTRRDGTEYAIPWTGSLGPGGYQRECLSLLQRKQIPATARCLDLACYKQTWPGRRADQALSVASDAALFGGAHEVCYWSSKHLMGPKASKIVRDWFLSQP